MQSEGCTSLASMFLELSPRLAFASLLHGRQIPMSHILLALMRDPYRCLLAGEGGALHRRHRSPSWNAHKPQVGISWTHANRLHVPPPPPTSPTPSPMTTDDCAGTRRRQNGAKASLRTVLSRRLWPRNSIQRLCCRRLNIPNTRRRPTRVDGAFLHSAPVFCVCY